MGKGKDLTEQMEMVSLEELVPEGHAYRKFKDLLDFEAIDARLTKLKKGNPHEGYGLITLFKCLFLQQLEDLSDRELERYVAENVVARWFCGFGLTAATPDHTVFTRARSRIGPEALAEIFAAMRDQLKAKGYMSEVFTFIDATHLIAKGQLWKERDELIKQKYEKMNNENVGKVASDKEARFGCKGGDKFWFGYKEHVSVDMQSGMINRVALTPANVTDANGMQPVCPSQGAIYADKGYCTAPARIAAAKAGCHLAAIKRNNMIGKNRDLDRWISGLRAPYEWVFSRIRKRVRYRGVLKNLFSALMQAIAFNLERSLALSIA
jgi:IS5 family transposase